MPPRVATRMASVLFAVAATAAYADVDLLPVMEEGVDPPALFSDGMILQREMTVPIFGRAGVGEQVTVTFRDQQKSTTTGGDGKWRVDLDPMTAGGPFDMTVAGNNTIVIHDVRVGEVWVAGGQSNMRRRPLRRTEVALDPTIRTLVRSNWNDSPGINPWKFAKDIQAALGGVPVGILNLAAGGTSAFSWLGDTAIDDPDPEVAQYLVDGWGEMYRKFVRPVEPYRIRGVIWWQGEEDAKRPLKHRALLPAVIRSWRAEWGIGDFPWIAMQVPTGRGLQTGGTPTALPANASGTDSSAFLRHNFQIILEEFRYTSMVCSLDLKGGTHPVDTDAYAGRLASHALALVYGQPLEYSGPLYASMEIEGSSVRIHYRAGTDDDLHARGGGALQGFAVTEDYETWHWATAVVDGNDVLLSSPAAPNPVGARYAWGERPTWANVVNSAGLAAAAFATDVTPGEWGP